MKIDGNNGIHMTRQDWLAAKVEQQLAVDNIAARKELRESRAIEYSRATDKRFWELYTSGLSYYGARILSKRD